MEYLVGRSLDNALCCLANKRQYQQAMEQFNFRLEDLLLQEHDAALGNGGLGRLAACSMDSMATLGFPAWGYGLRYQYGMFKQQIVNGFQFESPDYWLNFDNPWEIPRLDVTYEVWFYGSISSSGKWVEGEAVEAVAYDFPIPGYSDSTTLNVRLWDSKPKKKFDFASFDQGNYAKALEEQQKAQNITSVLYPNDSTFAGKELRLKQQYFFTSATVQDILRRFRKLQKPWSTLGNYVAIQLNDTHPTLAVVELLRVLVDEDGLVWNDAWENVILDKVFSFTNHTVLPEALEMWGIGLMERLLPRHLQLIYQINHWFLEKVGQKAPHLLGELSLFEEGPEKKVRMAHLAILASHSINGVAEMHSELIVSGLFRHFAAYFAGEKAFVNVTNGISQRRWLLCANPLLSSLLSSTFGTDSWITNLEMLKEFKYLAENHSFHAKWAAVKRKNKERLVAYVESTLGIQLNPDFLFDIQCKRFHEYKRQLMNILYVIYRWIQLRESGEATNNKNHSFTPRAIIFSGKAAPAYLNAKLVIKLVNAVANVINADTKCSQSLSVVFIPNYGVSLAELLIPAADISQHISCVGTEASGTSNMKFVLNGALLLGTLDGANVEIAQEIGMENVFAFGCSSAEQVAHVRRNSNHLKANEKLTKVIDCIKVGTFGDASIYGPLLDSIAPWNDHYLLNYDFDAYVEQQEAIDEEYKCQERWLYKSIYGALSMGKFSSDRSVREYAERIWRLEALKVEE